MKQTVNLTESGMFVKNPLCCSPFTKKWSVLGDDSIFTSSITVDPGSLDLVSWSRNELESQRHPLKERNEREMMKMKTNLDML